MEELMRAERSPTPVSRIGRLWVKRDDATSPVYGGNKVRKLERFFAAAEEQGKRRILTMGAVGSHQVVATAILGRALGFEVDAVLVPQPSSPHARANVGEAIAQGLRAFPAKSYARVPFELARAAKRDSYFVPLGGSNPLGTLGFVDAASELARQVREGAMPEPDVVVVAIGSGGTAAGLAVGFEKEGLATRVVGVAISPPAFAIGPMARRLARRTAKLAGLSPAAAVRAADRLDVDPSWLGSGYGRPTPAGDRAMAVAARAGLALDPTYTAKAFACALALADGPRTVLYWHTLAARAFEEVPLPAEIDALFT